jgi:hypothetical protein
MTRVNYIRCDGPCGRAAYSDREIHEMGLGFGPNGTHRCRQCELDAFSRDIQVIIARAFAASSKLTPEAPGSTIPPTEAAR